MKITANQIYLVFVLANIFCKGIGLNNSSVIYKIIMVVGLIAVLMGIVSKKYSRKEVFFSGVMMISGIMTLLITKQYTFLITCIAAIGIKRMNVEYLMQKICSVRTVCFALMFILALLNVVDRNKTEIWRNTAYVTRYGMGYGHPNTLHLTLFIVLTLNYYCNVKTKADMRKFWIISLLLNVFIYKYSASRTGFLVICIFELLILLQNFGFVKRNITKLPFIIFCTLMGFTFLTPILMKSGLLGGWLSLNGRTEYTYLYLTRYGYSLFGFNRSISNTGLILDNGYLRLMIETGVVGTLIWTLLNFALMRKLVNCSNIRMAIIVTCFYIYIYAESFSPNIFMNYILFWGADEIFNKWKKKDNYVHMPLGSPVCNEK